MQYAKFFKNVFLMRVMSMILSAGAMCVHAQAMEKTEIEEKVIKASSDSFPTLPPVDKDYESLWEDWKPGQGEYCKGDKVCKNYAYKGEKFFEKTIKKLSSKGEVLGIAYQLDFIDRVLNDPQEVKENPEGVSGLCAWATVNIIKIFMQSSRQDGLIMPIDIVNRTENLCIQTINLGNPYGYVALGDLFCYRLNTRANGLQQKINAGLQAIQAYIKAFETGGLCTAPIAINSVLKFLAKATDPQLLQWVKEAKTWVQEVSVRHPYVEKEGK